MSNSKPDNSFEFTLVSTAEPSDVVVDGCDVVDSESRSVTAEQVKNEQDDEEALEKRLARASSVGSAVLGCLVGGPILAIVLGVGAKFACEQPNSSCIRDTARAAGEVAMQVHEKAKKLDEQHSIVDESQRAVTNLWNRAKEADEKHRILEKTKDGVVTGYYTAAEYVHRHNLIERFFLGVGSAVIWLGDKAALLIAQNNSSESNPGTVPSRETQRVHLLHEREGHEIRVTE